MTRESHRALGVDSPRKKVKTGGSASSTPLPLSVCGLAFISSLDNADTNQKQNGTQCDPTIKERRPSRSSTRSSPMLLSNIPYSHAAASNVFKVEHPFR